MSLSFWRKWPFERLSLPALCATPIFLQTLAVFFFVFFSVVIEIVLCNSLRFFIVVLVHTRQRIAETGLDFFSVVLNIFVKYFPSFSTPWSSALGLVGFSRRRLAGNNTHSLDLPPFFWLIFVLINLICVEFKCMLFFSLFAMKVIYFLNVCMIEDV